MSTTVNSRTPANIRFSIEDHEFFELLIFTKFVSVKTDFITGLDIFKWDSESKQWTLRELLLFMISIVMYSVIKSCKIGIRRIMEGKIAVGRCLDSKLSTGVVNIPILLRFILSLR